MPALMALMLLLLLFPVNLFLMRLSADERSLPWLGLGSSCTTSVGVEIDLCS